MPVRVLRLRYPGACVRCGCPLPENTEAAWNDSDRTVMCRPCHRKQTGADPFAVPYVGDSAAGGSARKEYDRRRSQDHETRRSTEVWALGADGEQSLGRRLDRLGNIWVLHDRRIPGSRANIDHLVVAASGVWVVDAKRYTGRIERKTSGPLGLGSTRLIVGGRDRSNLVEGVNRQLEAVRTSLPVDVPVHGCICFVQGDWTLLSTPFKINGVFVHWPKSLAKALQTHGPIDRTRRGRIAEQLDAVFLPAAT